VYIEAHLGLCDHMKRAH